MDFILNEAIEEDNEFKLVFSDDSEGELFEEEDEGGRIRFYRRCCRRRATR